MKELVEEVQETMLANEQLEQLVSDAENKLKEADEKVLQLENIVLHLQEQLKMKMDKNTSEIECQVTAVQQSNGLQLCFYSYTFYLLLFLIFCFTSFFLFFHHSFTPPIQLSLQHIF